MLDAYSSILLLQDVKSAVKLVHVDHSGGGSVELAEVLLYHVFELHVLVKIEGQGLCRGVAEEVGRV